MSFNWEFTLQQLSMVILAGGLSAALFAVLRALGDRPPSWWRLWLEYPVVAIILYVIGARCVAGASVGMTGTTMTSPRRV